MEEALKAAEARANEAEYNMLKAAEAGKDLLQQLSVCEARREEAEQERHALKLSIAAKHDSEAALQDEIEAMRKALASQAEEARSERIRELELGGAEKAKAEAELDNLRHQLDEAKLAFASSVPLPDSPKDSASNSMLENSETVLNLMDELQAAKEQVESLKVDNERLKTDHDEISIHSHSLKAKIDQLKSTLEENDCELQSYRESLRQAKEELQMMQLEVDDDDLSVDVAPKGNSLFSEVEDRRHIAEDQLKKYKRLFEDAKTQYDVKTQQLQKMRMQNVALLNMASGGSKNDQGHVQRLEELLQRERNRTKCLTEQLETVDVNTAVVVQKNTSAKGNNDELLLMKQLQRQMRQNLEDGDKMQEMAVKTTNLERALAKLKAENYNLKMHLNELQTGHKRPKVTKQKSRVVEHIRFEDEETETAAPQCQEEGEKLVETNNILVEKENKKPKKKCVALAHDVIVKTIDEDEPMVASFNVEEDTTTTFAQATTKKNKKPKPGKVMDESTVINADEESEKMKEQCAQQ